jgi:hypothetical protein
MWTRDLSDLAALVGILLVPQVMGLLVGGHPTRRPPAFRLAGALLTPPALFYTAAYLAVLADFSRIQAHGGSVCGTAVGIMAWAVGVTTGIQFVFAGLTQLVLYGWRRCRQNRSARLDPSHSVPT